MAHKKPTKGQRAKTNKTSHKPKKAKKTKGGY